MIGHQFDATPFTTTLWMWPSRQFLNQEFASVQAVGCHLFQDCDMGDGVKDFAEIQVDNIHKYGHPLVIKGDHAGWVQFLICPLGAM